MQAAAQKELLERLLSSPQADVDALLNNLTSSEKNVVVQILREMKESGLSGSQTFNMLWEVDYKRRPVSIVEFLTSPDYMGDIGIFPKWKDELGTVCDPSANIFEWVLTGAIGTGKTTASIVAMCYKLYMLSCMNDPQQFYGAAKGSMIVFGLYNVFTYKVGTTSWEVMRSFVDMCPYFQEHFKRSEGKYSLLFPNKISVIAGSQELHALGENIYAVLLDEVNFMKGGGDPALAQAHRLYNATRNRIESRFQAMGKVPGLMCLVSSKKHESDFLEGHIAKVRGSKRTYVSDHSLWGVKYDRYSFYHAEMRGEDPHDFMFRVAVGDRYTKSRIMGDDGIPTPEEKVVWIPVEERESFERDLDLAIRDKAGIATYAINPLIPEASRILSCIDKNRAHPFFQEWITIDVKENDPIDGYLNLNALFDIFGSMRRPKFNPGVPRFIHIDIGLTGDCLGFSMGHNYKMEYRKQQRPDGSIYNAPVPHVYMDLMLQIRPPQGSEIDLSRVREFIFALQSNGYNIAGVSYDGFQSRDSVQILRRAGLESVILSMDRDETAYMLLRQLIMELRINYYNYQPFIKEVTYIKRNMEKGKIDKTPPQGDPTWVGHFDVADSVAGVCWWCCTYDKVPTGGFSPASELETMQKLVESPHEPSPEDFSWLTQDFKDINKVDPGWLLSDNHKRGRPQR